MVERHQHGSAICHQIFPSR